MVRVKQLVDWMDAYAPFRYTAKWDRCGLQVGDPAAPVRRMLVALDVTSKTLDEAIRLSCQCLLTHHPLLFHPLATVRDDEYPGGLVVRAIRGGISLIAAHTNLDVTKGGTNDQLSAALGLIEVVPFEVDESLGTADAPVGLGRLGRLPSPRSLADLARDIQGALMASMVRAVGRPERVVNRVALCTGSGGSLLELAIAGGVDVYVTGDLKYHEGQRAAEENLALIDVGHFASERIVVPPLAEYFRSRASVLGFELDVFESTVESDPFWTV